MQVGHDVPVVIGLVVLLALGLDGVEVLEHLVLGLPYLIYAQHYISLLSFAYLFTNLLNHFAFTLAFTFLSFLLQLL